MTYHWIAVSEEDNVHWSESGWTCVPTRMVAEHIQTIRPFRTIIGTDGSEVRVLGTSIRVLESPDEVRSLIAAAD